MRSPSPPDGGADAARDRALPLSRLEAACGLAIGLDPPTPLPAPTTGDPRAVLACVLLDVLRRGPTYVSFSGGRDSSAVLAATTTAARRDGLDDPIALTLRFPGVASTDEARWQELVIDHLRLRTWHVIEIDDELDLLGPIARHSLVKHGPLWPPNSHIHVPMFQRAAGASLITGFDGDGLFGDWRWARAQAVVHGRVRIARRDPARVLLACLPPAARRPLLRPVLARAAPWLTPAGTRELIRAARAHTAAEPRRWDRRVPFYARHRYLRLVTHSLAALGRDHGVSVVHPLTDAAFLAALAAAGGPAGFGDRTQTMRALFADLLPDALLARRGKAEFGRAIWRTTARAFAATWDGAGVDSELVDHGLLRHQWSAPNPMFGSSTLLQAAWLATHGR